MNKCVDIAIISNYELLNWLEEEFYYDVPNIIETTDDLTKSAYILMQITNTNSYLTNLLSYVSLLKRESKRNCDNYKKGSDAYLKAKKTYEDYVDKETILKTKIDSLDSVKNTISRLITIKQEINKELFAMQG